MVTNKGVFEPSKGKRSRVIFIKSPVELFSQKKSVLVIKNATYTHFVAVKTSDFFIETLPSFNVNISLNRSDSGKSFGLFKEYITYLNRL